MNELLKIVIAPLLAAGIQWWTSAKSKADLKADIELLELYKKSDADSPDYIVLKDAIALRLKKAYKVGENKRNDIDWSDLFWGIVLIGVAVAILLGFITEENVLKASLSIGFSLGAFFAFQRSFRRWFRK